MSKPRNVKTWDSERQSPQKRQERSQVKGEGYPKIKVASEISDWLFRLENSQRALKTLP